MKIYKTFALLVGGAALVAGCAPAVIGTAPAETPPALVQSADGVVWDRPGAFGPVPAEVAAAGAERCATLNTDDVSFVALGYHPMAQGLDGAPISGGGFFCVPG